MQIRTVTVSAQRKLPHPNIDFASVSAMVSLQADLVDGDDPMECIGRLQGEAEGYMDRHLEWVTERMKQRVAPPKAQSATAEKAAKLAEKYGGKP